MSRYTCSAAYLCQARAAAAAEEKAVGCPAQRFPPTVSEQRAAQDGSAEAPAPQSDPSRAQQRAATTRSQKPSAASMTAQAVAAKHRAWLQQQSRPNVQQLAAARTKLPISSFRLRCWQGCWLVWHRRVPLCARTD